jgi:hypothetical protein
MYSSEDTQLEENLEIAVLPPIDMAMWLKLRRNILFIPDINILGTNGYWRTGAIFNVTLSNQIPLVNMLRQMPEVEKVEVGVSEKGSDGDYYWNHTLELTPNICQRKMVFVTLKEDMG